MGPPSQDARPAPAGPTARRTLPAMKHAHPLRAALLLAACGLAAAPTARAQDAKPHAWVKDGQTRSIKVWADKGLMQSPVAVCLDWKGNLYVAESERAGTAVNDTRNLGKLNAVEEDLKFKRVEDRLAQINRWIAQGAFDKDYFTRTEDRIRLVRDTDGDGTADKSSVYAGGFNAPLDGIGAGVLWAPTPGATAGGPGTVYYTCIPNLWKLTSAPDGLSAASRESLSYGYGIRWCFYGHDLHGLVMGPDGRLYFSMGDRGFNVATKEGAQLEGVDRGGVFRCWPDGSGLELFHQGLRNPQCLAFNELGDLFTGDNNCDSGDRARAVYVAEQGDSGWRQDVQSLPSRGPWNREAIWKTLAEVPGTTPDGGVGALARPACFLPPIEYLGDGPSGLRFYPGVGESHDYDNHLFMVDFYGSGAKVHAFKPEPKGAGFAMGHNVVYYQGVTVTDLAFGYDGRLYMADWGGGWSPNLNGVVLVAQNDGVMADKSEAAAIAEVRAIFAAGFSQRPDAELLTLLAGRDSRVRLEAQHELARRDGALPLLTSLANDKLAPRLARIHAVWAVGETARRRPADAAGLTPLLADPDAELRAQAVRTLGDLPWDEGAGAPVARYVELLADPSPRVRREAALAVGKRGGPGAIGPLTTMLAQARDADPVLRSAGAYALSRTAPASALAGVADGKPPAVRLAVVLALRRLWSPDLAGFLDDADPAVAVEAARAVYDLRIDDGLEKLASMLSDKVPAPLRLEPFLRRAIAANVLLGTPEAAERLLAFAGDAAADAELRGLALDRVAGWDKPLKREDVWGNWVDLPARSAADAGAAVRARLAPVLASLSDKPELLAKAKALEARFSLSEADLLSRVNDHSRPDDERLAILDELARVSPAKAAEACGAILTGPDGALAAAGLLRARAEEVLAKSNPAAAAEHLAKAIDQGAAPDRQRSVRLVGSLAASGNPRADAVLTGLIEDLRANRLDDALALEVYEAAAEVGKKNSAAPAWEAMRPIGTVGNRPAGYSTILLREGGDAARGRELFLHHPSAECVRCHTADGLGVVGGNAGPNLTAVGRRLAPSKLVESIVDPAAEIAPGFGNVTAMPLMATILKPAEVRDVVAFLTTLKGPASSSPQLAAAHGPSSAHDAPVNPNDSPERWLILPALLLAALTLWPAIKQTPPSK